MFDLDRFDIDGFIKDTVALRVDSQKHQVGSRHSVDGVRPGTVNSDNVTVRVVFYGSFIYSFIK